MPNYHVTNRKGSGDWRVVKDNAERASSIAGTQKDAERIAKQFAEVAGGGEVRIHRPNGGPIRDSDTIGKKDPNPPKDMKH